jgi:hypothetical protein
METGHPTLSEAEAALDDLGETKKKEKVSKEAYGYLEIDFDHNEKFD